MFISGYGRLEDGVQAMKNGAHDFLEKPVHDSCLLAAIDAALGKARAEQEECARTTVIKRCYDALTLRERQVLKWVVTGLLNKQIAGRIGTTEKTVKVHRGRMVQKMKADSVPDLVRMAQVIGVLPAVNGGEP